MNNGKLVKNVVLTVAGRSCRLNSKIWFGLSLNEDTQLRVQEALGVAVVVLEEA